MAVLNTYTPKELLEKLPSFLTPDLRSDWHMKTILQLGTHALRIYDDEIAATQLIQRAGKALKLRKEYQDKALGIAIHKHRAYRKKSTALALIPRNESTSKIEVAKTEDKKIEKVETKADLQEFCLQNFPTLRYNELTRVVEIDGEEFRDIDLADSWLAHEYGLEVAKIAAKDSLIFLAKKNSYNPMEEYLEGLRENKANLKLLSIIEISAAFGIGRDDTLSQEMLTRHLIGVCKRGLEPGYKHDQILVLLGPQGCSKGQSIAALAPKKEWADSATKVPKSLEDRDFLAKINGCIIFEFDEIDKITIGKDAAEIKGFITRTTDKYVEKYETPTTSHPRRSILFGTSNQDELLNDHTGDRRFWIVPCGQCNPQWIKDNIDSIWATIYTLCEWGGLNWVPQGHPLALQAAERALDARISEPLEEIIRDILAFMNKELGKEPWKRKTMTLEI